MISWYFCLKIVSISNRNGKSDIWSLTHKLSHRLGHVTHVKAWHHWQGREWVISGEWMVIFYRFFEIVFRRLVTFGALQRDAYWSWHTNGQLTMSEVEDGRRRSTNYMEQENEWEREGLLDPAWEQQQKKVRYFAVFFYISGQLNVRS